MRTARTCLYFITLPQLISCSSSTVIFFFFVSGVYWYLQSIYRQFLYVCFSLPFLAFDVALDKLPHTFNRGVTHQMRLTLLQAEWMFDGGMMDACKSHQEWACSHRRSVMCLFFSPPLQECVIILKS